MCRVIRAAPHTNADVHSLIVPRFLLSASSSSSFIVFFFFEFAWSLLAPSPPLPRPAHVSPLPFPDISHAPLPVQRCHRTSLRSPSLFDSPGRQGWKRARSSHVLPSLFLSCFATHSLAPMFGKARQARRYQKRDATLSRFRWSATKAFRDVTELAEANATASAQRCISLATAALRTRRARPFKGCRSGSTPVGDVDRHISSANRRSGPY